MRILMLGAGGFIGSHLTNRTLGVTDHEVVAYDLYDEKLEDIRQHPRLEFIQGDIRQDHSRLRRMVQRCDLVIDLIAHANPSLYVKYPLDVVRLNFDENLRIAEYCARYGKRLIQFSTCEVYGKTVVPVVGSDLQNPDDPRYATFQEDASHLIVGPVNKHRWIYSSAKQLLERILHAYGLEGRLNYTIIRPFNFIGPRIDYLPSEADGNPRVFSHFVQALKDGSVMRLVNGGEQRRCYTLIDDAIDCTLRIIENPSGVCDCQIFNIGSPQNEVSIRQLALKMIDIYRQRWWDERRRLPELLTVSGDEFYGDGYDDSDRRIPDITKAVTLLGWQPQFGIDQVLERSMAYWFDVESSSAESSATAYRRLA
jgi:UDP-apiose/xylose synthase